MGFKGSPSIALVTSETRLAGLLSKFGTKGSARFRMGTARQHFQQKQATGIALAENADFERYVEEDERYTQAVRKIRSDLDGLGYPVVVVPRNYVASYYFGMTECVVVVGPDGLVANTAKYVGELPIVGVNPDPDRIDGVLLPFQVSEARRAVRRTIESRSECKRVTLAQVQLSDGQSLLAFNDFFVGRQTHVSSRYVLYAAGKNESQSSSGIIVATGAGSTGWLSSVANMVRGVSGWLNPQEASSRSATPSPMAWDTTYLRWVVREPFQSRATGVTLISGTIDAQNALRLESLMPEGGVIFSDGVESDFLEFNSGAIADFQLAPMQSRLVV